MLARILWDPRHDVNALADDWCTRFAGTKSAPYVKRYFQKWEDFWSRIVPRSDWFDWAKEDVYFAYQVGSYADSIPVGLLEELQDLLQRARDLAVSPKQQARMDALLTVFEYYRISLESYPSSALSPRHSKEAIALATWTKSSWRQRRDGAHRRHELLAEFASNPLFTHASKFAPRSLGQNWTGWSDQEFWSWWTILLRGNAVEGA